MTLIIIICLIGGCFYLYDLSKKPNNDMIIGAIGDHQTTHYSKPITSIEDSNFIQFEIMSSKTIDKPDIANGLPDVVIMIRDNQRPGTSSFNINVWFDESGVIFDMGESYSKYNSQYKETIGYGNEELIKLIKKYKPSI